MGQCGSRSWVKVKTKDTIGFLDPKNLYVATKIEFLSALDKKLPQCVKRKTSPVRVTFFWVMISSAYLMSPDVFYNVSKFGDILSSGYGDIAPPNFGDL